MSKTKVGVIGCGNISGIYFQNMTRVFQNLEVAACADLDLSRAKAKAAEYAGVKAMSVGRLLRDPEIKIVVNLTIPKAHASVALKSVKAGKSVHNEKPLTITRKEGQRLLALAAEKGVLVGCAPDTFMGAGLQTCRKIIDDGVIGEPVAATAFMMCRGHESWHPDPEFYYEVGGGPMFDMGPYYLTALVNMLGPVRRVTGSARISFPTRTITSEKKNGKVVQVETPTHIAGVMDFACGTVATIITSFDICHHNMPCIEIYGSKGSMRVPDPNCFGGPVSIKLAGDNDWRDVPLSHGNPENSRGIGVADMARAIEAGRRNRAGGEMAYHVLDVMHAFLDASAKGRHVDVKSTCAKPVALPPGMANGALD